MVSYNIVMKKKTPTSFSLSEEAVKALDDLAGHYGISKTGVLEIIIREKRRDVERDKASLFPAGKVA